MRPDELNPSRPSVPSVASRRQRTSVTTADIARHVGVSAATVSHVLNGRAAEQRIRPETEERVRRAIEELGYLPNASARATRTGRFGTVALLQSFRNIYLPGGLIRGVTRALEENNRYLVMATLPDIAFQDVAYLPKAMRELLADGLLINALIGIPDTYQELMRANQVPAVWINVNLREDSVHPDDFSGGRMATEYLLALGHERITFAIAGYVTKGTAEVHYSVDERQAGYEEAMQRAGLSPRIWELPTIGNSYPAIREESGVRAAVEFLQRDDRPSAIFAYEIETVMPILFAAAEIGLRIPADLSILMCHSIFENALGRAITTVVHDMEAIGQEAVRMLERKIQNPETAFPSRALPVYLEEGTTCAPWRKSRAS